MNEEIFHKTISGIRIGKHAKHHFYPLNLSAWENNPCPHCGSLTWVKIHRKWWQKILYPHKELCLCRKCKQKFLS